MKIVTGLKLVGKTLLELPGQTISVPNFEDAEGESWNSILPDFQPETWKLLVDETGMIRGYTKEADSFSLFEDEVCSVVEVTEDDLPKNFFDAGMHTAWSWFADRGVVTRVLPNDEFIALNKVIKAELMAEINRELQPLLLSEKHGIQTEDETAEQVRLEKLLIQIGRIDLKDRSAVWPDIN